MSDEADLSTKQVSELMLDTSKGLARAAPQRLADGWSAQF
jgi:hypothetical protein